MDYTIKIDEFEGPLDLLLHLIKESNIDIYDISIDVITKQYVDYINKMEELNINVCSSYLVMACELMEIKSKSLLPKVSHDDDVSDDYEENTKERLIERLLEYQKYKEVSNVFKELELDRKNIYVKSPSNIMEYVDESLSKSDMSSMDLFMAMDKFLKRKEMDKPLNTKITTKEYSVRDRKASIYNKLKEKDRVNFSELFDIYSKSYVVVTFLAILEMSKEDGIDIKQDKNFDDIVVSLRR